MSPLLWRTTLRHLAHHPWQLGLSLLGIALGVAVVLAVDLANESARRGFALSTEMLVGRATHRISAGPRGLPETLYPELRVGLGVRETAPAVEGYVALAGRPGRTLQVLGVDPFAERPFRDHLGTQTVSADLDLTALLTEPGAAVMSRALAADIGIERGESFSVLSGKGEQHAKLVGDLEEPAGGSVLQSILVVDISTAQEWLGMQGRLSHIDLIAPANPGEWLQDLEKRLPAGARLEPANAQASSMQQMTGAFHLNLTAMSLLALVVGMFLIYNAMSFSVVRRRRLLGTLRALGVQDREIFTLVLAEALLLGLAGALLGALLGLWLGEVLVRLVTRTINDLYYVLNVRELQLAPLSFLKAAGLGLGTTLLAAWLPAREAARVPAGAALREVHLEARIARALPRASLLGLLLLGGGLGLLAWEQQSLLPGFAGLFAVILGFAFLTPQLLVWMAQASEPLVARLAGLPGRMALREVPRTLSRSGLAVAALMVAVATANGVGVMVDSFRQTFALWLEQRLNADLYVAPIDRASGLQAGTLQPQVLAALRKSAWVAELATYRHVPAAQSGEGFDVLAVGLTPRVRDSLPLQSSLGDTLWPQFQAGQAVLVSEPLAYRRGLGPGDVLTLRTEQGPRGFRVGGVFYDYGSEYGRVLVDAATYRRLWADPSVGSAALYLVPGADPAQVRNELERSVGELQDLLIRPNREIRQLSMAIFERTFTITEVLRLIAVCVAFVGILSALMAIQIEKVRELAVLRACGLTPWETGRLIALQSGFQGLVAGLLALPVGVTLAALLVFVINRRSFGWTLQFQVDPLLLAQGVALAVAAAVLAALYPAWRMARTSPALALQAD